MQVSKYSLVTQLAYCTCILQNNRTGARHADMKWSKIKVLKALIVWWVFLFVEKHVHFEGTQLKGYCNLNKNR